MEIYHLALASDWAAARRSGAYAVSTRGRTLAEEGFIHAAYERQWQDVRRRYYAGVREPLVLLVIDTNRLGVPWREEQVGESAFPHIYGALDPGAVVRAVPLPPEGASFTRVFLGEMVYRIVLALVVMAFVLVGAAVVGSVWGSRWALIGVVVGAVVGVGIAVVIARVRRARTGG